MTEAEILKLIAGGENIQVEVKPPRAYARGILP